LDAKIAPQGVIIAREFTVKKAEADARQARDRQTFSALAAEFMAKHVRAKLRSSTQREYERVLTGDDTRHLVGVPIDSIQKADILRVLEAIQARGSLGAAGRYRAYLGKFFNWCVERELIAVSPAQRIPFEQTNGQRDRVLSRDEIYIIWQAFEAEAGFFGPLFKLLLLTGQRRGEVAGMRWSEIGGLEGPTPLWTLPGDRTKNKHPHVVPLSPRAAEQLRAMPRSGDLVFSTTGRTPVSGFGKAKARVDDWVAANHHEVPDWSLHDLRRTMVTVMNEELRIQPHVVEAIVNHVSGSAKRGVAGIYNKALYLDERRKALTAWERWLLGITTKEAMSNVHELTL
jgi:integrase